MPEDADCCELSFGNKSRRNSSVPLFSYTAENFRFRTFQTCVLVTQTARLPFSVRQWLLMHDKSVVFIDDVKNVKNGHNAAPLHYLEETKFPALQCQTEDSRWDNFSTLKQGQRSFPTKKHLLLLKYRVQIMPLLTNNEPPAKHRPL